MIKLGKLISACIDLAEESNIIIKTCREGDLQVYTKHENEQYTNADLATQEVIESTLKHLYPGIGFIGEEGERYNESSVKSSVNLNLLGDSLIPPEYLEIDLSRLCIWVDPLDGTNSYIRNSLDRVSVFIGISLDSAPFVGIVGLPYEEGSPVYYSIPGTGIFCKSNSSVSAPVPKQRNSTVSLARPWLSKDSAYHEFYDSLEIREYSDTKGLGKKGLGVATGAIDLLIYRENYMAAWDICAIAALVLTTGGAVSDLSGSPLLFNKDATIGLENGVVLSTGQGLLDHAVACWLRFKLVPSS